MIPCAFFVAGLDWKVDIIASRMRPHPAFFQLAALTLPVIAFAGPVRAADCEKFSSVALPATTFTAETVSAGEFTPPAAHRYENLPPFCRIAGVIKPTGDSYIRFEVWLPALGWNWKYLGVGNGGFAGSIDYNTLAGNLRRGYATAATDTTLKRMIRQEPSSRGRNLAISPRGHSLIRS